MFGLFCIVLLLAVFEDLVVGGGVGISKRMMHEICMLRKERSITKIMSNEHNRLTNFAKINVVLSTLSKYSNNILTRTNKCTGSELVVFLFRSSSSWSKRAFFQCA